MFADLCALDPEWDLETVHVIDPYFYSGPRDTGIGAVIEAFEEEERYLSPAEITDADIAMANQNGIAS